MQRLIDRNLLTALVLFFVGGVAIFSADNDVKNWVFPLMAAYLLIGIAVALVGHVIFAAIMKQLPDILRMAQEDRIPNIDVLVFFLIVLAYMFVMFGIGFWLSSFLMLSLTSIHLTLDKTRHNIMLDVVVPFFTCIVAYFIFLHLFYVPFPKAAWLGLG